MPKPPHKRQSRFARRPKIKPLVLTPRLKQLIVTVFLYRKLSRSQIQRLFGLRHASPTNLSLRRLYDNRFLDRRFRPTVIGSSEAIYTLGLRGVSVVADLQSLDPSDVKRRRRQDLAATNDALDHDLMANDFRINVENSLKSRPGFGLVRWLEPRDCQYIFKTSTSETAPTLYLKPDGYFEVNDGRNLFGFFVEIDRSTSGHTKLRRKFETYLAFKKTGLYEKKFAKELFYVLVVARTKSRAASLKSIADSLRSDQFWFTWFEGTRNHPLFANIWVRSKHKVAGPLFHPAERSA